jgi:hypothetical protein
MVLFFVSFKEVYCIDRSYITIHFDKPVKDDLCIKLTEQHDHSMQLKEKKNKIVVIKMKNKNACASPLIQLCNVKDFICKYAL